MDLSSFYAGERTFLQEENRRLLGGIKSKLESEVGLLVNILSDLRDVCSNQEYRLKMLEDKVFEQRG